MQVGLHDDDEQVCEMEGCTEIDLLPARCTNCHRVFCSQHISGSAHHCPAATDVVVANCPICHRVVQLEYAGQNVNEAVSRHIDRGCTSPTTKPIPPNNFNGYVPSQSNEASGPMSFLSRAMQRIMCTDDNETNTTSGRSRSGGRRLGQGQGSSTGLVAATAARRQQQQEGSGCGVEGCKSALGVFVPCDQCGRQFCTAHRNPAEHACPAMRLGNTNIIVSDGAATRVGQRPTNTVSPARASSNSSKANGKSGSTTTTNLETLLAQPSNTKTNAHGKKSESPMDMVTPLVCLLLPSEEGEDKNTSSSQHGSASPPESSLRHAESKSKAGAMRYFAIAPFYLHMNRNYALGRVLDLALDVVTLHRTSSPLPANVARQAQWNMFLLPLPLPSGVNGAMYPAQPLSTLVRNTPLCKGSRSVVVLSTLPTLPDELISAVRKLQKKM